MIRFLQTPGPTKKIVLGGLLLIICAAMVITLIPGGLGSEFTGQPGKGVVAKVAGNDITAEQVRQMARTIAQNEAARYGQQAAMLMPFLQQQATNQAFEYLVRRQMQLAEAQRLGIKSSKQEVLDELQHGRYAYAFFPGGNFVGQGQYEEMLQRAGLTIPAFEESVEKDILLTKLQALVAGTATVSEPDIRQQFIKQNTKVKFDYAILKLDDIKKGLHPAEAELKAYYDGHKNQYANSIPEKRKVKYAVIDSAKIGSSVQITQSELQDYYNQHRDQYRTPEQVKVSHILIKSPLPGTDGKVDDKALAQAQRRADDLLKQIKGGANFEELARKYSEDTVSAKQGGSLGFIGKGRTVPEFEKVAFSLPKGQISDVVKSSYGFHIIRVDDKSDAHMKSLEEVKAEIEPILKQQKTQQMAQQVANSLAADARSKGLDAAAAGKNIPVITSEFVSRRDVLPGIGPANQLMDAVFTAKENAAPDSAPTPQGFAVYQVVGIKPPATPTFEEIRSKVEEEFKNERASVLLSQKTAELSDRAKSEHDLKRAARELGGTLKTSEFVAPDGQVPDIGSMEGQASVAFNMKPGDISGPINTGANGIVLAVLESQAPSDADFAAKRDQIREQLVQSKQQEILDLFVSNLRDQMEKSGKLKINEQELKNLTRNGEEGL